MLKNTIYILLLILIFPFFISCANNKPKKDTSELYAKSQTRGALIERSGTIFRDEDTMWSDAQTRLQTGGGLFGKKPAQFLNIDDDEDGKQTYSSVGLPINPYLWRGSLETISFMPLAMADPFAGVIITDWYNTADDPNQRCKLNIFIKGVEFKTDNLKVNSFCQSLNENGTWTNQPVDKENDIKLENAILNKAKKIKISQS